MEVTEQLGKTAIEVSDTPGFVVNRVARPFYLEALRLVEVGGDPEQVDAAIRGAGFRMGPLQLADLIGMDINLAVSESLYERSYYQPRFRPSPFSASWSRLGSWDGRLDRASTSTMAPVAPQTRRRSRSLLPRAV
jgi:3-hydroxybutyryl-CoA dehydrogenase